MNYGSLNSWMQSHKQSQLWDLNICGFWCPWWVLEPIPDVAQGSAV